MMPRNKWFRVPPISRKAEDLVCFWNYEDGKEGWSGREDLNLRLLNTTLLHKLHQTHQSLFQVVPQLRRAGM